MGGIDHYRIKVEVDVANLVVRNIDVEIVKALKERAGKAGHSAEAEHRLILAKLLLMPKKKTFAEFLLSMPNVGNDSDFERIQIENDIDVFN
jgi:plasmid stability protein